MKNKTHAGLWIMLCMLAFLLVPLIQSKADMVERMNREVKMIASAFGTQEAMKIVKSANEFHAKYILGTVDKSINSLKGKEKDQTPLAHITESSAAAANAYHDALRTNIYGALLRLIMLAAWIPAIAPFMLAVIVDGSVIRKIKISGFAFLSPVGFTIARHMIIPLIFGPLLYLIAPIPITPLFVPFWALVSAFPIIVLISNAQRMRA